MSLASSGQVAAVNVNDTFGVDDAWRDAAGADKVFEPGAGIGVIVIVDGRRRVHAGQRQTTFRSSKKPLNSGW